MKSRSEPLWTGPEGEGPQGGITQGLIGAWLDDRERFRLKVVEGWKTSESWNHRLGYGEMWHCCEEKTATWENSLLTHTKEQIKRYPLQQEEISLWYARCVLTFPIYLQYWAEHPDVKQREVIAAEQVFDVDYLLTSGRTVRLRGKWDSLDRIGREGLYLQENKTKQDIDERAVKRQLAWDLQTMFYMVAVTKLAELKPKEFRHLGPLRGVRYNVVKRSAHYQGKKESRSDFLGRLRGIIEASPSDFFARWKCEVAPEEIAQFRRQCLDPILEAICDWWEAIAATPSDPFGTGVHWRTPYGWYSPLREGNPGDLDEYLHSGSTAGLKRAETLFPELEV